MMHLQNEQDLLSMFPEFVLSDISNLFKPMPEDEDHSSTNGVQGADVQGVYDCHAHCLLVCWDLVFLGFFCYMLFFLLKSRFC